MSDSPQITPPPPPDRPDDSHKGTYGTVVVIGGQPTMIGAPAMTATAAFRTGAGLVKIMTHPEAMPHCLTIEPSATGIETPYIDDEEEVRRTFAEFSPLTVLAVGPGMLESVIAHRGLMTILKHKFSTVLDAGGLNNLAAIADRIPKQHCPLVLTPHPGEFKRLAKPAGIDADPTDPEQRPDAAKALAEFYNAIVVLKGHRTVVSDGTRQYTNTTGNAALATAGSGDVLTGMIAALIAQNMGLFEAAVLGVYLHGYAADLWTEQHGPVGLLARNLSDLIPTAIKQHREAH